MFKFVLIAVFTLATCVGCGPKVVSTDGQPQTADQLAAAVSEERLEKLSEIVRSLRDSDSNMMYPREDMFLAAVKKAYPWQDVKNDVLLDGWGNPFVYTLYGDNRTYRLHSMGPNGTNEHGTGDDAPSRGRRDRLSSNKFRSCRIQARHFTQIFFLKRSQNARFEFARSVFNQRIIR